MHAKPWPESNLESSHRLAQTGQNFASTFVNWQEKSLGRMSSKILSQATGTPRDKCPAFGVQKKGNSCGFPDKETLRFSLRAEEGVIRTWRLGNS